MSTYLVFFARRGVKSLVWEPHENPLGVYEADTPEAACQAAAAYVGVMGAFFAIPGTFWGVTPGNVPQPFGTLESQETAIAKILDKISDRLALNGGHVETTAEEDE